MRPVSVSSPGWQISSVLEVLDGPDAKVGEFVGEKVSRRRRHWRDDQDWESGWRIVDVRLRAALQYGQ